MNGADHPPRCEGMVKPSSRMARRCPNTPLPGGELCAACLGASHAHGAEAIMAGVAKVARMVAGKEEPEAVDHPEHYGGDTVYEVIKVLEAWGLEDDALLWNTVKYVARAGKKGDLLQDLEKARFYLDRRITQIEEDRRE